MLFYTFTKPHNEVIFAATLCRIYERVRTDRWQVFLADRHDYLRLRWELAELLYRDISDSWNGRTFSSSACE